MTEKIERCPCKLHELVRAVFDAGFLIGKECGADSATAWEWGCRSDRPQTPDGAWDEFIKPLIESDFVKFDETDPKLWEQVP